MSGFDPREYERTGGNYDTEPTQERLAIFGQELDPESRFARDFGAFTRLNKALYEQAVADLDTEVPDDYVFRTNTGIDTNYFYDVGTLPNALNHHYLGNKVMQRMGYHVAIVPRQADRDNHIKVDGQVAVYQREGEAFVSCIPCEEAPGQWLLYEATGKPVHGNVLDRTAAFSSWYNDRYLAQLQDTGLLERAFMTGVLLKTRDEILRPTDTPVPVPELQEDGRKCIERYENLAKDGFTPLGPEEIYGLIATDINNWLEQHPEERPLEDSFVEE